MARLRPSLATTALFDGDLPFSSLAGLRLSKEIACDIETSGLDWRTDRIGACTLFAEGAGVLIIRIGDRRPVNLCALLDDSGPRKIFHHAMFDLRFMRQRWAVDARNVGCTKIAAKLLDPHDETDKSLKSLVASCFGITLDKSLQLSDWLTESLTPDQRAYAAGDVVYLPALLTALLSQLRARGLEQLAEACFRHIPARVLLDVNGYKDVFVY